MTIIKFTPAKLDRPKPDQKKGSVTPFGYFVRFLGLSLVLFFAMFLESSDSTLMGFLAFGLTTSFVLAVVNLLRGLIK
jgi:hypothetical protein